MSEKIKDYIAQAHSEDLYLPTRTIFLSGEVNLDMYETCIKNLHALDTSPETVTIYLNSHGGSVRQGFAIYNAIRAMKSMVRCVVWGEASSAASMILQAADDRVLAPDAELMIHIGQEAYGEDHPQNIRNWVDRNAVVAERMKEVYLSKIKQKKKRFTKKDFEDLWQFDKILSPKDAVKLGLADLILDGSL